MAVVMRSLAGACAVYVCAFLSTGAVATEAEVNANPMEKVISLLDVLSKQIEKEGKEDANTYRAYTAYYQKESGNGAKIIKVHASKIAQLTSDLKEAEAFRAGQNNKFVALQNKVAKSSSELTAGRQGRKKERAVFEKNEATYIESLDQLERSLETMKKKMPAASAAASSASLVSVAEGLKRTLMQDSDFPMSTAQRETLSGFMRAVQLRRVPSFLQTGSSGPYGDYSSKSGGLVSTLQDLSGKVKKERDVSLSAELKAKKAFKEFESGLTTMLENGKRSSTALKTSIAQSQETSSKKQATLMESKEIHKAQVNHMKQVEAEFRGKTQAYKIRLGKRSDEAIAVHEAQRILGSEIAKSYVKKQSVGSGFVQWKKVSHVLRHATSPGLVLLALRSTVHFRSGSTADPFNKVKTMIKGMLMNLNKKQAQESNHAAFCDKEMGKTAKSEKRKEEDVQKMKDRLDALSADLTQTKADIVDANKDLKEINGAVAESLKIREKEHKTASTSTKEYKKAAALLRRACNVLKGYYKNKAGGGAEVKKKEFKQRHGMGTGIIGILEIAIDDFEKLYSDTKETEEASAKDFKDMQEESGIRKAVFQKDLEYKSRTKVKSEFDQSQMTNDLKSYQKELKAIGTYMEKLQASCTIKGPSYAEKKAKREEELKSLKEALKYLSSQ